MNMHGRIKREECGYEEKPPAKQCSTCVEFASERLLPAWMQARNSQQTAFGAPALYSVEVNGIEKDMRCMRHGFAVKKTARCGDWRPKS